LKEIARDLKKKRVRFEDLRDMNSSEAASELANEEYVACKRAMKRNEKLLAQDQRKLKMARR
jgi:hypothetical protein